jgi:hypothetical protein
VTDKELLNTYKALLGTDIFRYRESDVVPRDYTAIIPPRGALERIYLAAIHVADSAHRQPQGLQASRCSRSGHERRQVFQQ